MPDLSSTKSASKNAVSSKKAPTQPPVKSSHDSDSRHGDSKRPGPKPSRSPPRRRARRSRSSSTSSSTSNSSSDSSSSSSSSSSHSSRGAQKKPRHVGDRRRKARHGSGNFKSDRSRHTKHSDRSGKPGPKPEQHSKSMDSSHNKQPDSKKDSKPPIIPTPTLKDLSSSKQPTDSEKASQISITSSQGQDNKTLCSTDSTKDSKGKSSGLVSLKSNQLESADKLVTPKSSENMEETQFTRVLVEKLTRNVTKAHIAEIFTVWGEVKSVEMPSGRIHPEFNRGIAYVEYADPKSANEAVNFMNGGQIDGQEVVVTEVLSTRTRDKEDDLRFRDKGRDRSRHRHQDSRRHGSHSRSRRDMNSPERHRDRGRREESDRKQDSRMRDRGRERQDRERDKMRDRERDRDKLRNNDMDRPRRARRGSSGSPFASRSGQAPDRPRSPLSGSRYRRPSPPGASRSSARKPRSRSPKDKQPAPTGRSGPNTKSPEHVNRSRRAPSSSSSSSSNSGSSNSSSSSSSRSGSSSSSSSSSSRSHS